MVRINGNSTERFEGYAIWKVEVMDDEGGWQLITACYGAGSLSSAVIIARAWRDGAKIPSILDAQEFMELA